MEAFTGSHEVYIAEVYKNRAQCLDTHKLARDIHYCPAHSIDINGIKATFPRKIDREKQVFLFLSNGDFSNVAQYLKDSVNSGLPREKIGLASNPYE